MKPTMKSRTIWYGLISTIAGMIVLWYENMEPMLEVMLGTMTPEKAMLVKSALVLLNGIAIIALRKATTQPIGNPDV